MFISISNAIGSTISFGRYVLSLISSFKQRVYADDGEFEAESCLVAQLQELQDIALLQSASLVITPSAVEENKLFSIIPTDGSGDLVVTRATTATRVNSDGLIEVTPYNLLRYSQQFDNVFWSQLDSSVVANSTIAPNGTNTAYSLLDNTSNFVHAIIPQISKAPTEITYSFSVFAKLKDSGKNIQLSFDDAVAGGVDSGIFNLSTGAWATPLGTPGAAFTNASRSFESVGNGWYRIILQVTSNGQPQLRSNIFVSNSSNQTFYVGNGTGIYIWGAQLVQGSSAKEYFPTTDRLDVPRLDYTNSSCPSILVEPQRTNLLQRSEEFDNVYWEKALVNVSTNSVTAPTGNLTADTITPTNTNGNHWVGKTGFSITSGTTYSYSVFAKNNGYNLVLSVGSSTVYTNCNFNLSNGTASTPYATAGANLCTPLIQNFGNGWYRCTIVFTAWTASNAFLYSSNNTTTTPIGSFGMATILGNGTSGFYLWGAQLEAGSYATSYIPTIASSVTRNADVISKTGISSLIGQTEGTILFDGIVNNIQNSGTNILNTNKNPSAASQIALTKVRSTNKIRFEQFFGNGTFGNIRLDSTNTFANGTRTKVAIRYKSGNFAMYINGNLEATSSSTFTNIGTKSELFLNDSTTLYSFQESVSFNSVALWKETLSNTELAQLTTI